MSADDWTRFAAACLDPIQAHHQSTNQRIDIDGDRATGVFYMAAHHHRAGDRGGSEYRQLGWYEAELIRDGDAWRVRRLKQKIQWCEGNPALIDVSRPEIVAPLRAVFGGDGDTRPLPEPTAPPQETGMPQDLLRELWDRTEIDQLMLRFGRALDLHDWPMYRATFTDRIDVDFRDLTGQPPSTVDADLWTDFARLILTPVTVLHQYSNHVIHIDGDGATSILYHVSRHHRANDRGASENVQYGWYDNGYTRTPQGWRISRLKHCFQWVEGNDRLLENSDPEFADVSRRVFARGAPRPCGGARSPRRRATRSARSSPIAASACRTTSVSRCWSMSTSNTSRSTSQVPRTPSIRARSTWSRTS